MAWFLNRYKCDRCGATWTEEWSCCCDDECGDCGARHISPTESDDLSIAVMGSRAGVECPDETWQPA